MHDIRFIREHPADFDAGLKRRNLEPCADDILAVDKGWRGAQTSMQELQSKRNELSKQVGEIKRKGGNADEIMAQVTALKDKMAEIEAVIPKLASDLDLIISAIPNLPAKDVPDGKDEKDNKEIRKSGVIRQIASPKQHFDIGEALGLMDFATAAKLSGARFTMLKGPLARLERAIGNFMLDIHTKEFGYTEISPPLMVLDKIMYGTAQLPKFADDQFLTTRGLTYTEYFQLMGRIAREGHQPQTGTNKYFEPPVDGQVLPTVLNEAGQVRYEQLRRELGGLWLIPTAEVPLTNIVNDMIINKEELPFRFTAKTPCFRAEAGAAGKDTRGMLRQHQFYKVELVSITTPDQSEKEHERMTECAETILKRLELPFRTMLLCTGDMGFASKKTYDLEVWMPGQNAYREISSCSNCGDFQARRMNARFKAAGEKNTEFLHTLNGSGVAVGRCLIAIIENFQEADGSVIIPPALRPYMDGMERIGSGK